MKNITSFTRGFGLLEVFLAKKRAQKANDLITDNLRTGIILDVGCGSYPYFLLNTKFKDKYGVDPSLKITSNQDIKLEKLDISKISLPFKENTIDVVTMLAVFEHIDKDKLDLVLSNIYKILKQNGIFIITTPAPWADKLLHNMAKIGLISSEEIHEHKTHYQRFEINDMLKKAGFNEYNGLESGYFELGLNMWFKAKK